MEILIDKNGYVTSYATLGGFEGSITVDEPEDMIDFEQNYQAYHYDGLEIKRDKSKVSQVELERKKDEIRLDRERMCFRVVNRGALWYETISAEQKAELSDWYKKWLDATDTMVEPKTPEWV